MTKHSLSTVIAITLLAGCSALAEPTPTPFPKKDPLIAPGKQLYSDFRCRYCHSLKGKGGTLGPALDNVGFRRSREWMKTHFRNPQKKSPDSKMVKLKLKENEIAALTAYMNSLGGYTFTPEAPVLFQKHCVSCHQSEAVGVDPELDLARVGNYRDVGFLRDYIRDAPKLYQKTKMRAYKGVLTESQIKDLAVYLYLQGR